MREYVKKDNILNSRFGKKNHFQVPAGYFDQLTDRVMANLRSRTPHHSHAAWLMAAYADSKDCGGCCYFGCDGSGSVLALEICRKHPACYGTCGPYGSESCCE